MTRKTQWIAVCLATLSGLIALWLWHPPTVGSVGWRSRDDASMLQAGVQAPPFTLPSAGGDPVRSEDLLGTRLALLFVRPGCPHCERLLAELSGVEDGNGGQILVVTAAGMESAGKLQSDHGLSLPVLADSTGSTASAYAVSAVPCVYLLDARGHIESSARGLPLPLRQNMVRGKITDRRVARSRDT